MSIQMTAEQEAIVAAAKTGENLMIDAKAGCAKTTTLVMMAQSMPVRPSLACAFNVKIKKELESRFPSHYDVKTINGLGHGAFSKKLGKRLEIRDKKMGDLLKELLKDEKINDQSSDDFIGILQIVRKARQVGLVPSGETRHRLALAEDTEETWEEIGDLCYSDLSDMQIYLARQLLRRSIDASFQAICDFDDQIYMSALFGGIFPKYPVVKVDEAQDLSRLNHIMLAQTALRQLIVVGDPRQAIYAFRGADSSSMDSLRELRPSWIDLPLSTTFRCPRLVVERQAYHAPGFNAAPGNRNGHIETLPSWKSALEAKNVAILCRNNAPIISAALQTIRAGKGCTVLGREIEKGLITLLKSKCDENDTAERAFEKIDQWRQTEISKAQANQKDERVAVIIDKAECLNAILEQEQVAHVYDAIRAIETMFASTNINLTLSTGHKAKGLEWDHVLHLDPWRIPGKFAIASKLAGNPIPYQQDINLRYVIETRTRDTLWLANLNTTENEYDILAADRSKASAITIDDLDFGEASPQPGKIAS